jgi:hypothetical protein
LLRVAPPAEVALTRAALDMITDRGYHRGRSLRSELDALLTA